MFRLKTILIIFCVVCCTATVHSVAPEDEPLQMLFDSFLPNSFLEKSVNSENSAKARDTKGSSAKTAERMKAAEAMVSGLKNIVDGLSHSDNGDCKFTCHNNAKPTHLPGFKPIPNGCGTHGFQADTSDLPGITECCNKHDICYGTCNSGQKECDSEFNRCMSVACVEMQKKGRFKSDQEMQECRGLGATFYLATASVGCEFYRDAQRSACLCDPRLQQRGGEDLDKQEKIRRYNSLKRARKLEADAKTKIDDANEDEEDAIDFSIPMFDLPDAIEHVEL